MGKTENIDSLWGHLHVCAPLLSSQGKPKSRLDLNLFSSYEPEAGKDIDVYLISKNESSLSGMASIIAGENLGLAPLTNIHSVLVDTTLSDETRALNKALQSIIQNLPQNLQNSSNQRTIICACIYAAPNNELIDTIQELNKMGLLIVLGVDIIGGHNSSAVLPHNPSLITVGALEDPSTVKGYRHADIFAPGYNITTVLPEDVNSNKSGHFISAAFVAGVAAAAWSKASTVLSASDVREYILNSSQIVSGIHHLVRGIEWFLPKWAVNETGILETFKPNQNVQRQLRCNNVVKGNFSFEIVDGFLPDGLSLSDDGLIFGKISLKANENPGHLNYFSTIIRATNAVGSVSRNISFVVTENTIQINHGNSVIAVAQLAKCDAYADLVPGDGIAFGNSGMTCGDNADGACNWPKDCIDYIGYPADCCFTGESLVLMADKSLKPISQVQNNDFVLQNGAPAKVLAIIALPLSKERKVYQLNKLPIYLTDEHPVYGADGKIYSLHAQGNKIDNVDIHTLTIGTKLLSSGGTTVVTEIKEVNVASTTTLFHLYVEGNGSYFVGDILTHRKHPGEISLHLQNKKKPSLISNVGLGAVVATLLFGCSFSDITKKFSSKKNTSKQSVEKRAAETAKAKEKDLNDLLNASGEMDSYQKSLYTIREAALKIPNLSPDMLMALSDEELKKVIDEQRNYIIDTYKKTFTRAEVKAIKEFYQSAAAKKMADLRASQMADGGKNTPIGKTILSLNQKIREEVKLKLPARKRVD